MDPEIVILNEGSMNWSKKDKHDMYHLYKNLKKSTNELIYKKTRVTDTEKKLLATRG